MRKRSDRRCERGVTLVEIGAVMGLVALVLGVGMFIFKPRVDAEQDRAALQTAQHIRDAVLTWRSENSSECPTLSRLELDHALPSSSRTDDPWGQRFRVSCSGSGVVVSSPGRDHKPNTPDDIVASHG
jgi:general secretion pathway protein G